MSWEKLKTFIGKNKYLLILAITITSMFYVSIYVDGRNDVLGMEESGFSTSLAYVLFPITGLLLPFHYVWVRISFTLSFIPDLILQIFAILIGSVYSYLVLSLTQTVFTNDIKNRYITYAVRTLFIITALALIAVGYSYVTWEIIWMNEPVLYPT